jgi:hypothetical protein
MMVPTYQARPLTNTAALSAFIALSPLLRTLSGTRSGPRADRPPAGNVTPPHG